MNKYKKALNTITDTFTYYVVGRDTNLLPSDNEIYDSMATLREIVNKETPKKPLDVCTPVVKWGLCPVCKGELNKLGGKPNRVFSNQKYCPDCGQALDWSEDE